MRSACLTVSMVLVVAGCQGTHQRFMRGGDDDTTHGDDDDTAVDAAGGGDAGSIDLAGRVCMMSDARQWSLCAATGVGTLTVKLYDGDTVVKSATTTDDGRFTILAAPRGAAAAGLVLVASGATIATSLIPYDPSAFAPILPAPTTSVWSGLQSSNGLFIPTEAGSVFVAVTRAGLPLAGVTATSIPVANSGTVYDPASNTTLWSTTETGAHGIALIAGIVAGFATVQASALDGEVDITGIPVRTGTITFFATILPATP